MVSAPQPEAVEAGLEALKAGGNAVDAAIACALVQTVVDPQMCGLAGFGSAQVYLARQDVHTFVDFHGRAPLATRPDMWEKIIAGEAEDGFGFILEARVNELGYQASTTPLALKAYDELLRRFGTRTLADLMEPAIAYCEAGCLVRPAVYNFWHEAPRAGREAHIALVTRNAAARRIYCRADGTTLRVGDTLRNPDMGRTLRRIARHGIADFYTGEIAREIAADMKANGGLISLEDLAECRTESLAPLWGTYRGFRIATNNPPGGGVMLIEMLNILEEFDLASLGHNSPDYIRVVAEAMKIATVDKDQRVGDPRFVEVPLAELTSKEYARRMAERIDRGEIAHVPRMSSGGAESKDTTHVCVADSEGNIVTMTHSLGSSSGVVTEGLGFMYNNCMAVFDPRPGRTGSLMPGKARFTAMSPTIVFKGNRPVLVVGAPGATYITMGNLQVILNVLELGMTAQEAVSAPRFSATSDTIELTNRILRRTERELQRLGYATRRYPMSYFFSRVHAIRIGEDGRMDGGADPGSDGMAMAV
jgi:gamma-glutamyltranspeptidase/glutathione hydrolase